MNKFVMGVFDLVSEECRSVLLISDMNLSRLMIYVKQMEGEKLRKRRRNEAKRAYFEGKFQSRKGGRFHQGQGSSHAPYRRFANNFPRAQDNGNMDPIDVCLKCGIGHGGSCLKNTGACYGCGKIGHKAIDYPQNFNNGKDVLSQGHYVNMFLRGEVVNKVVPQGIINFMLCMGGKRLMRCPMSSLVC